MSNVRAVGSETGFDFQRLEHGRKLVFAQTHTKNRISIQSYFFRRHQLRVHKMRFVTELGGNEGVVTTELPTLLWK